MRAAPDAAATGRLAAPGRTPLQPIALLGRLGTPQLACLRSWRRHGVPCVFLHAGDWPLPRTVQALLGVPCVHLGAMDFDDAAWVARLASALADRGAGAVTCVSEPISEQLWRHRDALPAGLRIAAVAPAAVQRLASKARQHALARASGLETLPSWCFAPGERVEALPEHLFPMAVRPDVAREAVPAFKVDVVADAAALQRLVDRQRPGSSAVIAQPLVRGPNLLVHAWRDAEGLCQGTLGFAVAVKHRGLSVVMQPEPLPESVAAGCMRMAQALGLAGVFHFDFVVDADGIPRFLDLNPRFGGTTGKALAAGYDEPLALLATLHPLRLPRQAFVAPQLATSGGKHQALRALWGTLSGSSTEADYPHPQRGRTVAALLRYLLTGRDELLRPGAWRSLLAFALYQAGRVRAGASSAR
jgi:hypothetical protein